MPAGDAVLIMVAAFLGPLGLLIGLLTPTGGARDRHRHAGVIVTVHRQHCFFMNWFGNQQGEGVAYHLLALGLATALIIGGAGRWSLDALVTGWR